MIEFKGVFTRELYTQGLRLHGTTPVWLGVVLIIAGVLGTIGVVLTGAGWVFVPLAIGAGGIALILHPRIAAARVIRTNALIRDGCSGTADESGLTLVSPHGSSSIPWDKFYRSNVTPEMILLYVSAEQFVILPKTFFTSETGWNELQTLVTQRVTAKDTTSSTLITAVVWASIVVIVFVIWKLRNG